MQVAKAKICQDKYKFNKSLHCSPTHNVKTWIKTNERRHEISKNVVCSTSKGSDQPAHTPSLLIRAFASRLIYSMTVKLLA